MLFVPKVMRFIPKVLQIIPFALIICTTLIAGCGKDQQEILKACIDTSTKDTVDVALQNIQVGKSCFMFSHWSGPTIPVWTYVPTSGNASTLPIVIVMHGVGRDGDRYRDEWVSVAEKKGLVIIAPEFSRTIFPGSEGYNLGYVFEKESNMRRDETQWAFSSIEPLFSHAIERLDSNQTEYTIYGHSAGSQFVHRFLFYKKDTRAKRYIPANAGWYTLPDFHEPYPYGFKDGGLDEEALKTALQKNVVILLGDQDTDINHKSLRRTPEAMRQGTNRLSRGVHFYAQAKQQAQTLKVPFNWQIAIVPGAVHSNAQMSIGAADFIQ